MTTISYVCRAVTVRVGLSLADRKTFSLAAPERGLPARSEAASRGDARRDRVVARSRPTTYARPVGSEGRAGKCGRRTAVRPDRLVAIAFKLARSVNPSTLTMRRVAARTWRAPLRTARFAH